VVGLILYPGSFVQAQTEAALIEQLYPPGHGSVSLSFQMLEVSEFNNGLQDVDIGEVSTRSVYFELEHALSERWQIRLGLPYIKKKYQGPAPHDPTILVPPRNTAPFVDDGHYHSNWQDLSIGLEYLLDTEPAVLQPYVLAFIPTHDYPHFAQAAVGQNLWKVEVGMELTWLPPFSYWFYHLDGGYVVVEETLATSVNHFRLHGEVGYFLRPDLSMSAFFMGKKGRGYNGDYPDRTTEDWYQHDRRGHHNILNAGFSTDWYFAERYQLTAATFTTVWGDEVHKLDWGLSVGITRYY
jgi:hypothetical protein